MLEKHKNDLFDIIIQGGQSNAEGCGGGPVTDEYIPSENVLYMNNDFTVSIAEERIWDGNKTNEFSLSFSREYIKSGKLEQGRKILVVRAAVGGTGWADNRWGMGQDLYLNMMRMVKAALELNPRNELKAFVWHQGETDSGTATEIHYNHLIALVKSVRETYNYNNLPFIAGDFVNEWKMKNLQACGPVSTAIRNVCRDLGGAFVETSDLKSNNQEIGNGDDIHFSRNALDIMGRRYFEAFEGI